MKEMAMNEEKMNEMPTDEASVVDTPVVDTPVDDKPTEDTPVDDTPTDDTPAPKMYHSPLVSAHALVKDYGTVKALKGIGINIGKGKIIGLLGALTVVEKPHLLKFLQGS